MVTWGSAGVFGSIGKAVKEYNADSVSPSAIQSRASAFVNAYILNNYGILGRSTSQSFADQLEDMIALMVEEAQTVNGNAVTYGSEDFEGLALGDTMTGLAATQMMIDDDTITIECVTAKVGTDSWRLTSMRRGSVGRTATTGVAYPAADTEDVAGLEFTIAAPAAEVFNDGSAIVGSADTITGGVKGTNCDADGKVWCKVEESAGTYTMTVYPTEGDRTGDSNAVATVVYTAIGSATVTEAASSGLAGTITIDTLATDAGLEIKLNVPYAKGDIYTIGDTTSDDLGVFQTFFRDAIKRTLPNDLVGGETIADSLAT